MKLKKIKKEKVRCDWCLSHPIYIKYHDEEWGVPVHNDIKHFEFLILEGAQAGLSWLTVLKRRIGYKKAFANFDPKKVAKFGERDITRLMKDEGIIRNKLKIQSAVKNAKLFLKLQKEFGSFDKYLWNFVKGKPIVGKRKTQKDIPATTELSDVISKDLKSRGFKFVGSTIVYAHLQAVGVLNDHLVSCYRFKN